MITKFDSLYAGHIDMDDVGYSGTAVNDRHFGNDQLAKAFDKATKIAQTVSGMRIKDIPRVRCCKTVVT